jgi:hypothetical protein
LVEEVCVVVKSLLGHAHYSPPTWLDGYVHDAAWKCGAPRFWGLTVPKYCTSHPTQRRVFWQNRSSNAGKWIASRAARR